jgi:hypothetical protein
MICDNEFCPGDSERDFIYVTEDENGKKIVVVEGKKIPEDEYKKDKYESR